MPHKKRTRNGRPKGQLKTKERDDLSDVSMCSMTSEAPMSKDEIMTRLLEEFQFAVQSRIAQIRATMKKAITDQRNLLKMELLKIPKDIRKMKVSEFLSAGGDMDELVLNAADPVDENDPPDSHDNIIAAVQQTATTAKKTARKPRVAKTPMAAPAVPQTGGRSTRGAKARALAVMKTQHNDMVTPARGIPNIAFITPKVPPSSACMTTGRKPKKGGELLYSLAGSPVQGLPTKNDLVNFTVKDGLKFDVSGAILDMSPKTLATHADQLSKIKTFVESKLQQIEKTAVTSTAKKTSGKSK
ncbi:uncharacterized protein LOC135685891 [Rhopilema esculentum]|uniref:uncharacterized protein LOC135685891 n=1 Tax=Rhopilema esculentum TaxID=499914 RepID=UPI0031D3D2AA|eukprot:gene181-9807_t